MAEKIVHLKDKDRARMKKIYNEIQSLLKEFARTGARAVSAENPKFAKLVKQAGGKAMKAQFTPQRTALKGAKRFRASSMVCFGSGAGMCLVYDYNLGVCQVV